MTHRLNPQLGDLVAKLWAHESIQKLFKRRSEFQLNDSAEFYFTEVARLSAEGYLPTTDDVLRSRVRTTGIVQSDFAIKGVNISMYVAHIRLSICGGALILFARFHFFTR